MYELLRPVSDIFKGLLDLIYQVIPNYGWSIIVLTIIFRMLLLPLDIRQKITMKKQAVLQPKLAKINEKYKNDKEKAAQKTMELYKQEKVSPFSGCLPALIQMPLFFAFFGALQILAGQEIFKMYTTVISQGMDAAQKYVTPWLWVHNVWAPDTALFGVGAPLGAFFGWSSWIIPSYTSVQGLTVFKGITAAQYDAVMNGLFAHNSSYFNGYFLLPLLAGLTSWLQTKLTMPAQQPAATQQPGGFNSKTLQYVFPVMSLFFTASSNSLFALYWITSNVVSIATYRTVDFVWKTREHRKEEEEKVKLEEAAKLAPEKTADTKAIEKPKGSNATGKTKPKEGKK